MLLRNELEQELKSFILENFTCDVEAGKIFRKNKNQELGHITTCDYVSITIKSRIEIRAHRIVWLFAHGDFPEGYIDHIDGNKQNNSISNLRLASQSLNSFNKKKTSIEKTSKYKGVYFRKDSNKWRCTISVNGKNVNLGCYDSEIEAAEIYNRKAIEIYGEFAHINIIE